MPFDNNPSTSFTLNNQYLPTGDQPKAISNLIEGTKKGFSRQTLLGVTGSGKTFTMANVISSLKRPALIIAHNKTLAAQLATEFQELLPEMPVHFFVSYYDYYQPEAYVARTDTYIEKETSINEEIERLRHASTSSLMKDKNVVIVASVSCIYGLGDPEDYSNVKINLKINEEKGLRNLTRNLISIQYQRNDLDLTRGSFRVRGDNLELIPSNEELALRIQFWGEEIEKITMIDPLTGEVIKNLNSVEIFPATHWVTSEQKLELALKNIEEKLEEHLKVLNSNNKLIEAQRLQQRTMFDLELLKETGVCPGIENYSRHISGRYPGMPPPTLIDYFPDNFLVFIDESHITLPQIRGMYKGDYSRKSTLVEHGFRLPSAIDNRPLKFEEFEERLNQIIFVSATPGDYETENEKNRATQIIRPTGLLDPTVEVFPSKNQIDVLIEWIQKTIKRQERVLVTTLTKRMAEELSDYLIEMGIKTHYLHSEIDTLERTKILTELRSGIFDVVVGINLLREGLDLPEVSLIAIMDADKEGYLRSSTSLIQTMGRAARHINGHVLMFADKMTKSMNLAINETQRRRTVQMKHNLENNLKPESIVKEIKDITERVKIYSTNEKNINYNELTNEQRIKLSKRLEKEMKTLAKSMEFEKAALIRDQLIDLRTSVK